MTVGSDESVLVITRTFDASLERVFDAWMEPKQWESWIGPEGVQCEVPQMEPKVSGSYRLLMKMSTGQPMNVTGTYKSIDRPKSFVFTWGPEDNPAITSTVAITLRDLGNGKTELTLRHEGLQTADNRDAHGRGWNSALNKLDAYLAKG
jgi:uncharacterized protein YndB with AHSA1/START domain